jgi:hypothetical protein
MKSKILKAQFNEMCLGGIFLDFQTVALFSGQSKMAAIEVTPKGINIQPGPGNSLYLNTLTVTGPLHRQSSLPADYLPGLTNMTPRKTFDMPIIYEMPNLINLSATYALVAGAIV